MAAALRKIPDCPGGRPRLLLPSDRSETKNQPRANRVFGGVGAVAAEGMNARPDHRLAGMARRRRPRPRNSGRNNHAHCVTHASRCAAERGADGASAPLLPRVISFPAFPQFAITRKSVYRLTLC